MTRLRWNSAALSLLFVCAQGRAQPSKPLVLVLPMPAQGISPSLEDAFLAEFAAVLRVEQPVRVLTGRAVRRAVFGSLGSGIEEATQAFEDLLSRGQKAYHNLQLDRAEELLTSATRQLEICGPELSERRSLFDLRVYMGLTARAQGRAPQAEAEFQRAVAFDPSANLTPKKYPPDIVQAFERVKRSVLDTKQAQVRIMSQPVDADVMLDGRRVGKTPLTLNLYPAEHYLRLQLGGHAPWTVVIPEGSPPAELQALLIPQWNGEAPKELLATAIAREEPSTFAVELLGQIADTYSSKAVLLLSLSRVGSEIHMGHRLFVRDAQAVFPARLFNLGARRDQYQNKYKGIAASLEALASLDKPSESPPPPTASAPAPVSSAPPPVSKPVAASNRLVASSNKPFAFGNKPVVGETKPASGGSSTPWYKTWWFWTSTGVVLAGTAAALGAYYLQPEGSWTLVVQPRP